MTFYLLQFAFQSMIKMLVLKLMIGLTYDYFWLFIDLLLKGSRKIVAELRIC